MLSWLKARFQHPSAPNLYAYHHPQLPNAGAQEMVLNRRLADPIQNVVGTGVLAGSWRTSQGAQIMVMRQTTAAGFGTQAGMLYSQPLLQNPENPAQGT